MNGAREKVLALHAICVLVLSLCFWLSQTVLKGSAAGEALMGAGLLLWGKLGFEPATPVKARLVERALQQMSPDEIKRMSARPPTGEGSSDQAS